MTLITYLTRVHFADGVLEDALHSEMEAHGKRRPLIIAAQSDLDGAGAERVFAGLPRRTTPVAYSQIPGMPTERAGRQIAALYAEHACDMLIAFGGAPAMDLAKVARVSIAHDAPIGEFTEAEGGGGRITVHMPPVYAIPGIDGFASAITNFTPLLLDDGRLGLMISPNLIPCITICDPTLTLGESAEASATAAAGVLARSIDAFLSPRFHPPAEGLALDSLVRVQANIHTVLSNDSLAARRQMMAGALNSALSLQKGQCALHAIGNAVAFASGARLDQSALGGVLIPHLVAHYEDLANGALTPIKRSLGIAPEASLSAGLSDLMNDWPVSRALSDLGVDPGMLARAAGFATRDRAIDNGPKPLREPEIRAILRAAH